MTTEDRAPEGRVRLQLDVPAEFARILDEHVIALHAASRAEVVRRSVGFLVAILGEVRKGRTLCFRNPDGTYTDIFPFI